METYELLLCAGMLAAALGDAAFQGLPENWRWMVGAPIVPALLLSREPPAAAPFWPVVARGGPWWPVRCIKGCCT